MEKSKNRLSGIVFARAFCTIGILIYHYFCHSKVKFILLYSIVNINLGFYLVTSFFSISGTVLYYNYQKDISLKIFYFKRWKSIFPSYYICFIYFYIKNVFKYKKLFYGGHWSRLIFTVFGMDGYLGYRFKTYYIVGEWFLGSIIILYIIYPLLSISMNKNILIIHFITLSLYPFIYLSNYFTIMKSRNLITCLYSFYFGMLTIKFNSIFFKNKRILIISFIFFLFLSIIKTSKFILLIYQMQGLLFYIILVQIGKLLMLTQFKIIFIEISKLSYNIFLIHHQIILDILDVYNGKEWYLHIILLSLSILLTIICSKILFILVNNVINSYNFKKIELMFIKT